MPIMTQRSFNRTDGEMRPLEFKTGVNRYAEGAVMVSYGFTQVLCTCSIEDKVPEWLRGKGQGWVTAEYAMLPRATHTRGKRDREKVSGRTQEIQRLIGRALRSVVDLKKLGERTLMIDCDVLQADGGTRTASITGACVALGLALKTKGLEQAFIDTVAGVSLGVHGPRILVDLDYDEDSSCDVDFNFIATGAGKLIEVQGTAERGGFTGTQLGEMTCTALGVLDQIRAAQVKVLGK